MPLTDSFTVKTLLGIGATDTSQDSAIAICVDAATAAVKAYLRRGLNYVLCPNWPETDTAQVMYHSGTNFPAIALPFTPVTSVASVYFDSKAFFGTGTDPFPSSTLLTAGTDYVLMADDGTTVSTSGLLLRLGGRGSTATGSMFGEDFGGWFGGGFFSPSTLTPGSLTANGRRAAVWGSYPGAYKITFSSGFATLPDDLKHATSMLAVWLVNSRKRGLPLSNESYQGYSYSLLSSGTTSYPEIGTIRQLLARWRCQSVSF